VLALPRAARGQALRIGGRRFTFPMPPARDQCGYSVYAPGLSVAAEPILGIERR
jgi:hypothetical protein